MEDEHQEAVIDSETPNVLDNLRQLFEAIAERTADPPATFEAMWRSAVEKLNGVMKYRERLNNPDLEAAPENIADELRPWAGNLRRRAGDLLAGAEERKRQLDTAPEPQEIAELKRMASLKVTKPNLADNDLAEILERAQTATINASRIGTEAYAGLRRYDQYLADIEIRSYRSYIARVQRSLRLFSVVRSLRWWILIIAFAAVSN
jgi:hypothetical protein